MKSITGCIALIGVIAATGTASAHLSCRSEHHVYIHREHTAYVPDYYRSDRAYYAPRYHTHYIERPHYRTVYVYEREPYYSEPYWAGPAYGDYYYDGGGPYLNVGFGGGDWDDD